MSLRPAAAQLSTYAFCPSCGIEHGPALIVTEGQAPPGSVVEFTCGNCERRWRWRAAELNLWVLIGEVIE